eukprot:gene19260-21188_t
MLQVNLTRILQSVFLRRVALYPRSRNASSTPPVQDALKQLEDIAVTPSQADVYRKAIEIYNPAYSTEHPGFVAFPKDVKDLQRCLKVANDTGTPVAVKSGGHSFAGYSTIDKQGFVIALNKLSKVTLNENILTVQAGTNWCNVYGALEGTKYMAVGGCVPAVGIGGYLLGGGYSMLSRAHGGLGCDKAVSFTMVTADGSQVVTATKDTNEDLFWAMKGGGGGNFGVMVEAELKVEPRPHSFIWKRLFYNDSEHIEEAINLIGQNLLTFPKELNLDIATHSFHTDRTLTLDAVYCDHHKDITEAALNALNPQKTSEATSYTSFLEFTTEYSKRHGFVHHEVEPMYAKGAMITGFSTELANYFANVDMPSECLIEFVHMGGDIKEIGVKDTAFPYRSAEYSFYTYGRFNDDKHKEEVIDFATVAYNKVKASKQALGSYVNYMDRHLQNWQSEFYGVNYDRLCQIKNKWNPIGKGPLHFQQEIGSNWQPTLD